MQQIIIMKVLLAYYPFGEVTKVINTAEKIFSKKGFEITKYCVQLKKELSMKEQKKNEKVLQLKEKPKSVKQYDLIVLGTPIVKLSSVPAMNVFIRAVKDAQGKKFVLFATGIGLPGKALKKMNSLLSMKGAKVIASDSFMSIFEFDSKKLLETENFFLKAINEA